MIKKKTEQDKISQRKEIFIEVIDRIYRNWSSCQSDHIFQEACLMNEWVNI